MKETVIIFLIFFCFGFWIHQHSSGLEAPEVEEKKECVKKLNERLPPIEFVFVNCAESKGSFDKPLTSGGIDEAIRAGYLLKDFKRPYIVCGNSTALKRTAKFLAEQMSLNNTRNAIEIGYYNEVDINPVLDSTDETFCLQDKLMDLIRDGYSHERTLILVGNSHIFEVLQKELTTSHINIKNGDVCVFIPISNKLWKIDYRPN
jgi:hypothetical protein